MTINDKFQGFPIDYFTFNETDFNPDGQDKYLFSKENMDLEDGYIGNSLYEKVNFDEKDTTVINCAVGQGKTHAILHSIKEYLNKEESTDAFFIIAVPLVSLVTQYKKDLLSMGFDETQIFSYENISEIVPKSGESYKNIYCKVHIVTVNTLLGNPGENAILQSERKYNYIKNFAEELSSNGMRLIVIYDEIHEAIKNFSETGIAYMAHFSSVLCKNILISATYNVQSIPVIKLLASQTNNKIRLLESERIINKPQSKLYLHYINEYSPKNYTPITNIVLELVNKGKKIDILSYSRKLCKCLADTSKEPGKSLKTKFKNIRLCVSSIENNQGDNDEDLNKTRFDNSFCNIGTNFKSGVSIKKENHAFVIILPPASSRSTYTSFNGIFSEGPNSVIQALARQRNVGEIHIVLPKPIIMDFDSLPSNRQQNRKLNFQRFLKMSLCQLEVYLQLIMLKYLKQDIFHFQSI
ncbi:DEAD/DEAH box helicase family protein [Riemerella anatipestifer]|uniref:DEAD/DEAH box helicase family protein n=1 Tax=Riemerella anatipestifer TaxID=34085 RepID=UPI00069AF8AE|nr:DEAD/DEAH box helicase family protein [Riemerella anatipestifer]